MRRVMIVFGAGAFCSLAGVAVGYVVAWLLSDPSSEVEHALAASPANISWRRR